MKIYAITTILSMIVIYLLYGNLFNALFVGFFAGVLLGTFLYLMRSDKKVAKAKSDVDREIEERMENVAKEFGGEVIRAKDSKLSEWLEVSVIGQQEAIRDIVDTIYSNVRKQEIIGQKRKVLGVFMFVGLTGVGKTEMAKAMGVWFGSKYGHQFLRFDMGNFSDRHMASTLTGSARGYIGSEEGGALTRPLMKKPNAVILFDEIEKGDRSLYKVFMSLTDEGIIQETSTGQYATLSQGVIIFTSNLMQRTIRELNSNVSDSIEREVLMREVLTGSFERALKYVSRESIQHDLMHRAGEFLPPEFLGRIDRIIAFRDLSDRDLYEIAIKQVVKLGIKPDREVIMVAYERAKPIAKQYGVRQFVKKFEEELLKTI